MGRSPCCEKEAGLKKGPWTPEEDQKLLAFIDQHGHGCWRSLPAKAGESWSAIATHLPKRTDNEIKNYWNTHLKKRLAKMGIDPVTHKPRADAPPGSSGSGARYRATAAHLSHTAQWETARLEAEARLAREAKLRALASPPPAPAPAATGLESPTSTLSFSESAALFVGGANAHDDMRGVLTSSSYGGEAFAEQHRFISDPNAATGFLAGVLLDCSDAGGEEEQRFAAASTDASVVEQEEEEKGYWSSILNMVNSSMSSSSSSLTSEAVTGPAMYLPPPAAAAAEF
ncbi:hypothetical protein HU200_038975 [Digitaria exilis]|uniref:Uncharacterized protein n=1 Tax=Digitaria exilis TaxID=1010633 RepID=A0A835ELI2_9POAL|nr:hypothetical protein HU200_038975 [Digitaria exilis]CAB3450171.1 unnamed protein product [Digitaria exilis]